MTPLSAQSRAGGATRRKPWPAASSASAARMAWLAATPPAITRTLAGPARGRTMRAREQSPSRAPPGRERCRRPPPGTTRRDRRRRRPTAAPPSRPRDAARSSVRRARSRRPAGRAAGAAGRNAGRRRAVPRPRSPVRRDRRGRAVSRPCRRPRRAHRRWWCRAGGSGRRPSTATNWVWPPETRRRR